MGALLVVTTAALFFMSVVFLDDPISRGLRARVEAFSNAQNERLYLRARNGALTGFDRMTLHGATLAGVAMGWVAYPEASAILFHYVYGDGSELELSSSYFRRSPYLSARIAELGPGRHGPIGFEQSRDWRLSLAFNPYYLDVDGECVRLWHPRIAFAAVSGEPTRTAVPIGKLRIQVYDNLISALDPTPFAAYSRWTRTSAEP